MQRMQEVQSTGHDVLLISANSAYRDLASALDKHDVSGIRILDVLSTSLGLAPDPRPDHVVCVPSPTMLEMTAMRMEQIRRIMGSDVHIIVDSLDALARSNPLHAVEEFTHYLVNRMRSMDVPGDLLVTDSEIGTRLADAAHPYTDGHILLENRP